MNIVRQELRNNPLLWLLAFVPVLLVAARIKPDSHTLLFVLSILAIVPLAALLSRATESVAVKMGDAAGGLLNATLGNLTELVIALDRPARRTVCAGKSLHCRRDSHQHALHARRVRFSWAGSNIMFKNSTGSAPVCRRGCSSWPPSRS